MVYLFIKGVHFYKYNAEDKKQEVKDNDKKNSQESEAVPDGVEVNPDNPVGNNVDEII